MMAFDLTTADEAALCLSLFMNISTFSTTYKQKHCKKVKTKLCPLHCTLSNLSVNLQLRFGILNEER
jgi:hypothetical protein